MSSFMVHDKWEDVLFVHYKIPVSSPDFDLLQKNCPFALDVVRPTSRVDSGNGTTGEARHLQGHNPADDVDDVEQAFAWLGLVFLTERNVGLGSSLLRGPSRFLHTFLNAPTLITHHGVNVRTYVEGDGIFFYSLECDSFLATEGARQFGIPYRYAKIARTFGGGGKTKTMRVQTARLGRLQLDMSKTHVTVITNEDEYDEAGAVEKDLGGSDENGCLFHETVGAEDGCAKPVLDRTFLKADENIVDETKCHKSKSASTSSRTKKMFSFSPFQRKRRSPSATPCALEDEETVTPQANEGPTNTAVSTTGTAFGFDCEWTTSGPDGNHNTTSSDAAWRQDATALVERYKVYSVGTSLTGCLTGSVSHERWPVQKAELRKLVLNPPASSPPREQSSSKASDSGQVDEDEDDAKTATTEATLQDFLQRLTKSRAPDHVCYSPGVGPVRFTFLNPYTPGSNCNAKEKTNVVVTGTPKPSINAWTRQSIKLL